MSEQNSPDSNASFTPSAETPKAEMPKNTSESTDTQSTAAKATSVAKDSTSQEDNSTNLCLVNRSKREFTDGLIGRKKSKKNKYLAFLGILVLIAGWLAFMAYKTLYSPLDMPKQMVTIDKGETYYGLIDKWDKKQKLFFAPLAKLYVKTQMDKSLYSGVYQMPANPTFVQVLDILQQGEKVALTKVQVIEGKTAKVLYATLNDLPSIKKELLNLPADQQAKAFTDNFLSKVDPSVFPEGFLASPYAGNLEGWFSPDTYYFGEGTSDKKVLGDLFDRQYKALMESWNTRQADLPYKNPYEALIMASIIEKETSVPAERNEVAGVFVNRLKKGMKLQTDPTVIYGMGERYNGNITKADLAEKTAYNTYQIDGLPPTPIALPSIESIKAALNPNQTDSLYFVATGNGGHKFTSNLADHNQAVQDYLKVMRDKKSQGSAQ